MSALVPRPSAELSTDRHDPRDDWHKLARDLANDLAEIYGNGDPLPTAAGAWIARQKSDHTKRAYARAFRRWEKYARSTGGHAHRAVRSRRRAALQPEPRLPARADRPVIGRLGGLGSMFAQADDVHVPSVGHTEWWTQGEAVNFSLSNHS